MTASVLCKNIDEQAPNFLFIKESDFFFIKENKLECLKTGKESKK